MNIAPRALPKSRGRCSGTGAHTLGAWRGIRFVRDMKNCGKPLENFLLEPVFKNNETKKFDMNPYLETGAFKKLKDKKIFNQVKISFDSVEWPGGTDLDPEILHEKSR